MLLYLSIIEIIEIIEIIHYFTVIRFSLVDNLSSKLNHHLTAMEIALGKKTPAMDITPEHHQLIACHTRLSYDHLFNQSITYLK